MNTQPTVIRKHRLGTIVIVFTGGVSSGLVCIFMMFLYQQGHLSTTIYIVLSAVLVTVVAATLITLWVYRQSFIALFDTKLQVTNWYTPFYCSSDNCEWSQIEDVTIRKGRIFSQLLGFASIFIQTAGTQNNLIMTMVPNAEYWRTVMTAKAESAVAKASPTSGPIDPFTA